jgi:CubicO group peptidase (beta-lactamase class C family)
VKRLALAVLLLTSSLFADDVASILRDRVDVRAKATGIVVGIVTPEGTTFHAYGTLGKTRRAAVDEHTLFRVASATKVFTSLLLADMVERGDVSLDDPVSKYLPPDVKLPKPFTLRDLATHRSGLPAMPGNFSDRREYTERDLYVFLGSCKLESDPGAHYRYSNLGMALLGHALARKAGLTYAELLQSRILAPLKMTASTIHVDAGDERLATGHDLNLRPATFHASNETLAGASELVSDVEDLTRFVSAALGLTPSPLRAAFDRSMEPLQSRDEYHAQIGLGWWLDQRRDRTFVWHGGESRDGYKSFIGLDRAHRIGVVVLANSRNGIEDIGLHLLDARMPVHPFGKPRVVALDPSKLDDYAGSYQIRPSYTVVVEKEGHRLLGHANGRPRPLLPLGDDSFRIDIGGEPINLDFLRDTNGRITSLLMYGGGQSGEGERLRLSRAGRVLWGAPTLKAPTHAQDKLRTP